MRTEIQKIRPERQRVPECPGLPGSINVFYPSLKVREKVISLHEKWYYECSICGNFPLLFDILYVK